jgi:hypothetical protein
MARGVVTVFGGAAGKTASQADGRRLRRKAGFVWKIATRAVSCGGDYSQHGARGRGVDGRSSVVI